MQNNNRTLFLDLDGVFADFEAYFLSEFGVAHDSMSDAEMWSLIDSHPGFFRHLPFLPGSREFLSLIATCVTSDVVILTACPKKNYHRHAVDKMEWVRDYMGKYWVLPVLGGKNKTLFMRRPGDVLIDDFEKNIIPWNERDGNGFHFTGNYKQAWNHVTTFIPGIYQQNGVNYEKWYD